ncbi:MAG: hypothetical protein Q8M34_11250 [Thermodesulfovibrionales bacterium]|nr:hypothetical protein [Thermodesulfovibrionales bacterium]
MLQLLPFYCLEHLPDLIGLGSPFTVLNVYSRITGPRRFIDPVAAAYLPGPSEVMVADFAKISKANTRWIITHLRHDLSHISHISHIIIVSIMISIVNV